MSDTPTPSDDFSPNASPATSQKASFPTALWILGGLGCGCLSLVVLGIMAAIALPAFLNQANKAKQVEAKTYVGSMLRGQQAYFIEQAEFAPTIDQLGLGLNTETGNYRYKLVPGDNASVFVYAEPKDSMLRGFAGAVYAVGDTPATATTYTGLCQSDDLGQVPPTPPALDIDMAEPEVVCPPGSSTAD